MNRYVDTISWQYSKSRAIRYSWRETSTVPLYQSVFTTTSKSWARVELGESAWTELRLPSRSSQSIVDHFGFLTFDWRSIWYARGAKESLSGRPVILSHYVRKDASWGEDLDLSLSAKTRANFSPAEARLFLDWNALYPPPSLRRILLTLLCSARETQHNGLNFKIDIADPIYLGPKSRFN